MFSHTENTHVDKTRVRRHHLSTMGPLLDAVVLFYSLIGEVHLMFQGLSSRKVLVFAVCFFQPWGSRTECSMRAVSLGLSPSVCLSPVPGSTC